MDDPRELAARLKSKYPMLCHFTDRPFGVEIEFYGLRYYILPPDNGIIKPYNVHSRAGDGRDFQKLLEDSGLSLGTTGERWHLEEDSSITHRGGVELISPILRGIEGLIEAYRFFRFLCSIEEVKIDESCGFHVHHGVAPESYGCRNLKELVRIVYAMEDYLYLLIPGDRISRKTCRPMELDTRFFLKEIDCDEECKKYGCRIKMLWYSDGNGYDPESNRSDRYDLTRYHGLNLHSFWYRSTIEFRYHSAVLEQIDEAMQWIVFTQFLVELSTGNIPQIRYHASANKWMKTIYKIYLAFGHMNRILGWGPGRSHQPAGKEKP